MEKPDLKKHGGKRIGAGPKPKHSEPMVKLNARIPAPLKVQLIDEFGGIQAAVNALIIQPRLGVANEQEA